MAGQFERATLPLGDRLLLASPECRGTEMSDHYRYTGDSVATLTGQMKKMTRLNVNQVDRIVKIWHLAVFTSIHGTINDPLTPYLDPVIVDELFTRQLGCNCCDNAAHFNFNLIVFYSDR
jgi:hypothetical protein